MSTNRIVFLRTGWMDHYQGLTGADRITGGGSFVNANGFGHEIFNFQNDDGRVYGYVQPPGKIAAGEVQPRIEIMRLGAKASDESVSGITAVWVATAPQGGTFIIGWYKNATIFRRWQQPPRASKRVHYSENFGYYVTADAADASLVASDARVVRVPTGKGAIGQSNVWYADGDIDPKLLDEIEEYVAVGHVPRQRQPSGTPWQPDLAKRLKVEQIAMEVTAAHYVSLGYELKLVAEENMGWDISAAHADRQINLKIEVKGLSGPDVCVQLTPNEYAKLRQHHGEYRICVVTMALEKPCLSIFVHSEERGVWQDQHGRTLRFEEIVSARCEAD